MLIRSPTTTSTRHIRGPLWDAMSESTPRPFAFMRLTHEALREGFAAMSRLAAEGDVDGVHREYTRLERAIAVHAAQEEQAFFPMLDERFHGAIANAGLREAHHVEEAHQEGLRTALASGVPSLVREALVAWADSFEAHLAREEEVMMPLTRRVARTLEGRAAAVRTLLEADWEGLSRDHLPYVVKTLAATRPFGPVRTFVFAVQLAAGERYHELAPAIADNLPAETRDELRDLGHLPDVEEAATAER